MLFDLPYSAWTPFCVAQLYCSGVCSPIFKIAPCVETTSPSVLGPRLLTASMSLMGAEMRSKARSFSGTSSLGFDISLLFVLYVANPAFMYCWNLVLSSGATLSTLRSLKLDLGTWNDSTPPRLFL